MKIKHIIKESSYRDKQRDILLQRIADADDPIERAKLIARFEAQFPESYSRDQEGGVAQGMDQADEINSIAVAKAAGLPAVSTTAGMDQADGIDSTQERGAGYELDRAQREYDEYLKRQAKELARMKANAGMKDSDYKTSPGSKRTAQDMAPDKANADMKDSDYKTSPGSKRTAQDLALDKEYTYKAPDGRRLKYKHGDIRNAFHSSPDSRKAGSDKVIRGDRVGKRLVDKKPVPRTNQDDRSK